MAQAITDFKGFLSDAKQIALELSDLEQSEAQAKQEEERLLKALESEKKAVADNISPVSYTHLPPHKSKQ